MDDFEKVEKFSWSGLFLVTAICSFLFNVGIKILDGTYSNVLLYIGIIAVGLTVLNWMGRALSQQFTKKKKTKRLIPEN